MKFFKHFTDAHRGQSLQSVKNRLGLEGVARYWILVEICAEKLEKKSDEEFTEEHCVFVFDRRYLRDTLSTHQLSGVEKFLRCLADVGLMSYTCVDDVVEIRMPKLLESMDRDAKRARHDRAAGAPKKKNKEEDKDILWKNESELCFQAIRKFTSDYEAMNWLGESRKAYIEDLGGLKFIRGLKDNDFEVKRLANLIRNSWERIESSKESA